MSGAHFDELIHAPLRLRACALLAPVDVLGFGLLRDSLGVSDSVLSKHLSVLEAAGYVSVAKVKLGTRLFTTISMTDAGRVALRGHLAVLADLAAQAETVSSAGDSSAKRAEIESPAEPVL